MRRTMLPTTLWLAVLFLAVGCSGLQRPEAGSRGLEAKAAPPRGGLDEVDVAAFPAPDYDPPCGSGAYLSSRQRRLLEEEYQSLRIESVVVGKASPSSDASSTTGLVRLTIQRGGHPVVGAAAVATSTGVQVSSGLTGEGGRLRLDLAPGDYQIHVYYYADQPVRIGPVPVQIGHLTPVDLVVTLGRR